MSDGSDYTSRMSEWLERLRLRSPAREPDEAKCREAMRRSQRAKALREDPDLSLAFQTIEDVYLDAWRSSDALDVERRERCYGFVCLLRDLRKYLDVCVENGDAARATLEKFASRG